jgi:hypothetical protein
MDDSYESNISQHIWSPGFGQVGGIECILKVVFGCSSLLLQLDSLGFPPIADLRHCLCSALQNPALNFIVKFAFSYDFLKISLVVD